MDLEYYNNDIINGFDSGEVIVTNTNPINVAATPVFPTQITINKLSNLPSLLKLDSDVSNMFMGIITTFITCLLIEDYYKAIIILIVSIFLCSNIVYGFVFAFAIFSAAQLAKGNLVFITLLIITILHLLIQSNLFGFKTNPVIDSSLNIDWLLIIVETLCLITCIVFPMITKSKDKMSNREDCSWDETQKNNMLQNILTSFGNM